MPRSWSTIITGLLKECVKLIYSTDRRKHRFIIILHMSFGLCSQGEGRQLILKNSLLSRPFNKSFSEAPVLPHTAARTATHCRTAAHCRTATHALLHCHTRTAKRTAAHCRTHCAHCVHTTVRTATHYTAACTDTHSRAHCRTLLRCRTATHCRAHYHTLPSALPHTAPRTACTLP
jgi:hypothetical protein